MLLVVGWFAPRSHQISLSKNLTLVRFGIRGRSVDLVHVQSTEKPPAYMYCTYCRSMRSNWSVMCHCVWNLRFLSAPPPSNPETTYRGWFCDQSFVIRQERDQQQEQEKDAMHHPWFRLRLRIVRVRVN